MLNSIDVPFSLSALESKAVYKNQIPKMLAGHCDRDQCFIYLTCSDKKQTIIATNTYWLTNFADVELTPPQITIQSVTQTSLTEADISLVATAPAPYVFVSTAVAGRFSDNAFLMFPGQQVNLTFYGWEEFNVNHLNLQVESVQDSYPHN